MANIKKLIITMALSASVASLSGCKFLNDLNREMDRMYQRSYCNVDAAYYNGKDAARQGQNFDERYGYGCHNSDQEALRRAYLRGYKIGVLEKEARR